MRISALVALVFQVFYLVMLARVVLSWVRLPPRSVLARHVAPWIYRVTEPVLRPVRRALRPYQGTIPVDVSPMIAIFALAVLERIAYLALRSMGL